MAFIQLFLGLGGAASMFCLCAGVVVCFGICDTRQEHEKTINHAATWGESAIMNTIYCSGCVIVLSTIGLWGFTLFQIVTNTVTDGNGVSMLANM